jgi:hypothetical protein
MKKIPRQYPNLADKLKLNSFILVKEERKAPEEIGLKILLGMTLLKLLYKIVD